VGGASDPGYRWVSLFRSSSTTTSPIRPRPHMRYDQGPPVLSADVLDLIVDELRGDKSALAACALASSVLLPRARRHIFHDVEINEGRDDRQLLDFLDADPSLAHAFVSVCIYFMSDGDLPWTPDPNRRLLGCLPYLRSLIFMTLD
jgi:hypothetical protein